MSYLNQKTVHSPSLILSKKTANDMVQRKQPNQTHWRLQSTLTTQSPTWLAYRVMSTHESHARCLSFWSRLWDLKPLITCAPVLTTMMLINICLWCWKASPEVKRQDKQPLLHLDSLADIALPHYFAILQNSTRLWNSALNHQHWSWIDRKWPQMPVTNIISVSRCMSYESNDWGQFTHSTI